MWDPKTRKLYGYNASGKAPAGRDLAQMVAKAKAIATRMGVPYVPHVPRYGSLSVTVPGAVDGWFALHDRFGKLPMGDDPRARDRLCHGTAVRSPQMIAQNWKRNMGLFEARPRDDRGVRQCAQHLSDRRPHPAEGEMFRNPDLAATLGKIAAGGRDVYYKGEIAKTADAYFKRIGGDLRYGDFADYRGEWVEPQSVTYHGYDVFELPPNSQGFGVLQMLRLLEPYDLKAMGTGQPRVGHDRARGEAARL